MKLERVTRPIASSQEDIDGCETEMSQENVTGYDLRFSKFIGYVSGIFVFLLTASICWTAATLVAVKSDIAVLIARPPSVSKEEYARDATRWDTDIIELKKETNELNHDIDKVREYDHFRSH